MANRRLVGGKTTPERLEHVWQSIIASGERVTVTEFARRAMISPHTLTHRYPRWADTCRAWRDSTDPNILPSSITQPAGVRTASEKPQAVQEFQARCRQLLGQCKQLERERAHLERRLVRLEACKAENERLRGVIVVYQQIIRQHLAPELLDSSLRIVEEWAPDEGDTSED